MIAKLQRKYALSEQGAKDLIIGCIACAVQNISLMFPVALLYTLVGDLMTGTVREHAALYVYLFSILCVGLIF